MIVFSVDDVCVSVKWYSWNNLIILIFLSTDLAPEATNMQVRW